jgi:multidrug efflux pump subunit AcrA (membrane-fusion protein)
MKFIKFLFPLVILAVGVGVFVQLKNNKIEQEPLETRIVSPLVNVQDVALVSAIPITRLFGEVESPDSSNLTSAIEADVVDVYILEGESVETGQLLVRLDDTDLSLELSQREAELQEVEAQIQNTKIQLEADKSALRTEKLLLKLIRNSVERAKKLAQSQAGSLATLDEALQNEQRQLLAILKRQQSIDEFPSSQLQLEARKRKAEALIKKAQNDLARTEVYAPADGKVTDVLVSHGDRVTRGGMLVQLYDKTRLEVRVQVPSDYIPVLQGALDNDALVTATAVHNSASIDLTLHRLSAGVSEGQGGVDAFFRSSSGSGKLPTLGITLEIRLSLPAVDDAVVTFVDALYGKNRVYKVVDNVLEAVEVEFLGELNNENGQRMVIISGKNLQQSDQILISRLPQAVSGLTVEISQI